MEDSKSPSFERHPLSLEEMEALVSEVELYATKLISENITLGFHNLEHTQRVVHWTNTLCEACKISDINQQLLLIAAWFHDTGFSKAYLGHERKSIEIMEEFLDGKLPAIEIFKIKSLIQSTALPQLPDDRLQQIICDADLSHLGDSDYFEWLDKLRKEWGDHLEYEFNDDDWWKLNVAFLEHHEYKTKEATQLLGEQKAKNLNQLLINHKKT